MGDYEDDFEDIPLPKKPLDFSQDNKPQKLENAASFAFKDKYSDDDEKDEEKSQTNNHNADSDDEDDDIFANEDERINFHLLMGAIIRGDAMDFNRLMKLDSVPFSAKDNHGWNLIHCCCANSRLEFLQQIVEQVRRSRKNLQVLLKSKEKITGNSPLHFACVTGKVDCIKYLVELGSPIEAQNNLSEYPVDCITESKIYKAVNDILHVHGYIDAYSLSQTATMRK